MKMLNRAKCIHSKDYVVGQWLKIKEQCFIVCDGGGAKVEDMMGWFDDGMLDGHIIMQDGIYEVEESTRSINFEDMLDKNNKPIFASLSEDGIGGDNLYGQEYYSIGNMSNDVYRDFRAVIKLSSLVFRRIVFGEEMDFDRGYYTNIEVTGIYEGEDNGNKN